MVEYADAEAMRKLCDEARENGFAMVAVNSAQTALCKSLLKGTPVRVGAAISFPLGQTTVETKVLRNVLTEAPTPITPLSSTPALTKRPHVNAPRSSLTMLISGVALSMGIWQMSPAMRPTTADCATVGLVRMIARQYMAMMKLGFMPKEAKKLPTVSFRTAPAARSTAMRMRS